MTLEVDIQYGDYAAQIRREGGGLNSLSYKGRNLIDPFQASDPRFFRGDILAPWPNRIADGKYEVEGKNYTVAINEAERRTALHGLVFSLLWEVLDASQDHIRLGVDLPASDCYPTSLYLEVSYRLSAHGLSISISAENTGSANAPYGVSIHPYLIASDGQSVDQWTLRLHSNKVLDVDEVRLLPIALKSCEDMNFDFRDGAKIGTRFIDHAFTVDDSKPRTISLRADNGDGVEMTFDETSHWVQIHTADRDGGDTSRRCLAVEPMTCPPDAFRSGVDLIWLGAGEKTESSWRIQKL